MRSFIRKISNRLFKSKLPMIRGGIDLVRKFFARVLPRNDFLIKDFDGNLKFYCDLTDHLGSQIFWFGYYSEGELRAIEHFLKPDMVFVDVGANVGEFTLFMAKRLTVGKVIAFEPNSYIFNKLKRNIEINKFNNIQLVKKALSDKVGTASIFDAKGRFRDGTWHEGLFTLVSGIDNRNQKVEQVDLIPLDNFLESNQKIDIMKIDVEGSELAVLKGAMQTISRYHPIIFIEVSNITSRPAGYDQTEILEFLGKLNYEFKLILDSGETHPITSNELSEYQNIVCIPRNHIYD